MEELMKLKDTLCNELEEYSRKGKMSAGDLEVVDKLTHTIKNLDKIIENYEEYSGAMDYSRERGYSNRYSMARDGRGRGRNANPGHTAKNADRREYLEEVVIRADISRNIPEKEWMAIPDMIW